MCVILTPPYICLISFTVILLAIRSSEFHVAGHERLHEAVSCPYFSYHSRASPFCSCRETMNFSLARLEMLLQCFVTTWTQRRSTYPWIEDWFDRIYIHCRKKHNLRSGKSFLPRQPATGKAARVATPHQRLDLANKVYRSHPLYLFHTIYVQLVLYHLGISNQRLR